MATATYKFELTPKSTEQWPKISDVMSIMLVGKYVAHKTTTGSQIYIYLHRVSLTCYNDCIQLRVQNEFP